MARPDWTVVEGSKGRSGERPPRVPRDITRLAVAAALLVFAVLGTAAAGLLDADRAVSAIRLAEENAALRAELASMNAHLDTLRGSLDHLAGRDEFIRLLAGLDPLDAGIRQATAEEPGQGAKKSSLWRLDRALARRAFETRTELNGLLRRARMLTFSWGEAEDNLADARARLEATPSIYPTAGYVSSTFKPQRWHPLLDRPRPHEGLDIVAPAGTPIVAAAAGRVTYAGALGEYGLTIEIDHGHGLVTRYAHASRLLASVGEVVTRGDTIGRVGSTGLAMGSHLHYEVLVDGKAANPRNYILGWNTIPD